MDEDNLKPETYTVALFLEGGLQIQFLANAEAFERIAASLKRKPKKRSVFRMAVLQDARARTLVIDMARVLSIEASNALYLKTEKEENANDSH